MRVSYKRAAVKDMEATRDYIAERLKNPKAAKKLTTALLKAIAYVLSRNYNFFLVFPVMTIFLWPSMEPINGLKWLNRTDFQ